MQKNIKCNWTPPAGEVSNHVTVYYKINKKGKLQDVSIVSSSGDKEVDNAVIEALKKTKFEPLPKDFKKIILR